MEEEEGDPVEDFQGRLPHCIQIPFATTRRDYFKEASVVVIFHYLGSEKTEKNGLELQSTVKPAILISNVSHLVSKALCVVYPR